MIARRAILTIALLSAPCVAASPATQATTRAISAIDADRAINLAQTVHQLSDYTPAPPAAVNRVVVLGIDHGRLTLRTAVHTTPSIQRIDLTDLPGLTALNVRQLKDAGGPAPADGQPFTPDFFMFTHYDFSDPKFSESALTAALTPMNLQLALDSESPTDVQNISLVQTTGAFSNAEPSIRLRVSVKKNSSDTATVNFERTAADFTTLRRTYPDECAQYIEPMLHILHADAGVFSPDPKLIWQVFAADVPADPAMTTRVKSIIARFDADDYHDRKTAAEDLNKLGEPAALALLRMDRTTLSPEQSSRVESFLAPYQPVSAADAKRLGGDVNFLLDCLFDRDPAAVHDAVERLKQVTKQPIDFDANSMVELRREAIAALRRKLTPTTRPTR